MADRTPVPRSKWIREIPFDYLDEIGEKHDPYAKDGLFEDEADFRRQAEKARKLPPTMNPEDRPGD